MLYPGTIYDKLGFTEVKQLLREECQSVMGKDLVDKMQFITHFDLLKKILSQAREFKQLMDSGQNFPSGHYHDLKPLLQKAGVEGAYLTEEEVFKVWQVLHTVFAILDFFKDKEGLYPNIETLFADLKKDTALAVQIEKVIDQKGIIRQNASKELAAIFAEISRAGAEAYKKIQAVYKHAQKEGYSGDAQLTVREGRLVIPILAEHKRRIKGYIHDESATGQTVFIEPGEVFELNNRIRDLEFDKKREIIRILTALTAEMKPSLPLLQSYRQFLTIIDFVRAKALLARRMDADMPELLHSPSLELINARHPLLLLSFKSQGKEVVPLSLTLNDEARVMVVSGPNAGGKSVALKTVGVIQVMLQHGLLVPASNFSKIGIFKKIFADIGDDQSLESDLSTYSAHLSNMKAFVEQAGGSSLVLIDEFGTGTDPKFGGPIAEAVLEVLNRKKVRGVITTHYSNLKVYANAAPGVFNASMLFDTASMRPLYKLEIGKPGSSYAFEVARKIGLPEEVLELAQQKVGVEPKKIDMLLAEIEQDKAQSVTIRKAAEEERRKYEKLRRETEELQSYLEENRKQLIRDAKAEAREIVQQANKLVEHTVKQIIEAKAEKEPTKKIREGLQQHLEQLQEPKQARKKTPQATDVQVGNWVRVRDTNAVGKVIKITKEQVELAIGDIRSVVKLNRLEPADKPLAAEQREGISATYVSRTAEDRTLFSPQIDIRGKRGDEALAEVDKFIDKALMFGFSTVKILHGKGDGILRKLVREYLRKYAEVEQIEDEHVEFGGDGITVVTLG